VIALLTDDDVINSCPLVRPVAEAVAPLKELLYEAVEELLMARSFGVT